MITFSGGWTKTLLASVDKLNLNGMKIWMTFLLLWPCQSTMLDVNQKDRQACASMGPVKFKAMVSKR